MATPFSDVYDSFLTKIDDTTILTLPTDDMDGILMNWLLSSITLFPKCKKDLTDLDKALQQFNQDLDYFEIEILASWMKYSYLDKKVYREMLLTQPLSNKDYAMYSPANHLQQLINLKELTFKEVTKKVTDYLYNSVDYGELG